MAAATSRTTSPPKTAPQPRQKPDPVLLADEQLTLDGNPDGVERPTDHKGVPITREVLIGSLPKAPFRISRIHLSDGTSAYACRDCPVTGDTRGEVMIHRNDLHGASYGKGRVKTSIAPLVKEVLDPVLPPRGDGPAPTNPLEMTLGEFLSLTPTLAALGDLVDQTERERDAALDELAERRAHDKENAAKIAHWDTNREELIALRSWKRKMIKRLTDMGFVLNEEGD